MAPAPAASGQAEPSTGIDPGQAEFQMRMARGQASLNKSDPQYNGADGEKLRKQDRENYKQETGMYPEEDKDLVASAKADKRYGKSK